MSLIFLAFANDRERPLKYLSLEDKEVYRSLSRGMAEGHYQVHRDSFTSLDEVARYLSEYRNSISVFHFSGHAGRNTLLMSGKKVNGISIADLLGICPKLKLVILNGCSTRGQFEKLIHLPTRPAVIATSAAVQDSSAKDFSIAFWHSFSRLNWPLGEAYVSGLTAANRTKLGAERGIDTMKKSDSDEALWDLHIPEDYEKRIKWKLLNTRMAVEGDIEPNELLLESLPEAFAVFDADAKSELKKIADYEEANLEDYPEGDQKKIRKHITINCLPPPISVHITSLFSKSTNKASKQIYYDKPDINRLEQLLVTYKIAMELPAFVLLAQLFDLLSPKKSSIRLSRNQFEPVNRFLSKPNQSSLLEIYFPMIEAIKQVLHQNAIPLFIPEMVNFDIHNNEAFKKAIWGLEDMNQKDFSPLDTAEIKQLCEEAEAMLACVLSNLNFLAAYTMFYVRDISVRYNRHNDPAKYLHRINHLATSYSGDFKDGKVLENYLPSKSVLLERKQKSKSQKNFLNLAPFVINQNAYLPTGNVVNLHCFDYFKEGEKEYLFKHIENPAGKPMLIKETETKQKKAFVTKAVWKQFEKFRILIQTAAL